MANASAMQLRGLYEQVYHISPDDPLHQATMAGGEPAAGFALMPGGMIPT